jgi:hypothetical protein
VLYEARFGYGNRKPALYCSARMVNSKNKNVAPLAINKERSVTISSFRLKPWSATYQTAT